MPRVLVMEDHPLLRLDLCLLLHAAGYECHTAQNGHTAFQCLQTHQCDVVITHHRLGRLDSMTFLNTLEALDLQPVPQVILLSNNLDPSFWKTAYSAGAFCVVGTPYDPCDLLLSVQKALTSQRQGLQSKKTHSSPVAMHVPTHS